VTVAAGTPPSPPATAAGGRPLRRLSALLLAIVLAVRLGTLGTYPLGDSSEARYGEIARVMRETGNWVTPQETPGTPFWAKPPLYAWLGAAATYVFGVDEFALRLPSLLCGFAVLVLCALWARSLARASGSERDDAALLSCLILATTVLFFVGYGAVMTDPSLGLCTAWMMVAFQRAVIERSGGAVWRYGLFIAAGLAMLAKGPVAFLYVALPAALWATWCRRWRGIWQALPWLGGTALWAVIALPWYAWAEARTPGFLNYFLVGEHVMRYLKPGWSGDRYGNAHIEVIGTIWAYLVGAVGLWTIPTLMLVWPRHAWIERARTWCRDDARLFALLAVLTPLVVFTFARNLIWTYVMPVLTPLSVLLGTELAARCAQAPAWRRTVAAVATASAALLCVGVIGWAPLRANGSSFAAPVAAWRRQAQADPGAPRALWYWGRKVPASLRFYSRGAAEAAPELDARLAQLVPGARVYIAIVPEQLPALRQMAQGNGFGLTVIGQVKHAVIAEVAR